MAIYLIILEGLEDETDIHFIWTGFTVFALGADKVAKLLEFLGDAFD
jgi:hypothetical protein